MAQLLQKLVGKTGHGKGQQAGRSVVQEAIQDRFRCQQPKEFVGTTDSLEAEGWIKFLEVIFYYLQLV